MISPVAWRKMIRLPMDPRPCPTTQLQRGFGEPWYCIQRQEASCQSTNMIYRKWHDHWQDRFSGIMKMMVKYLPLVNFTSEQCTLGDHPPTSCNDATTICEPPDWQKPVATPQFHNVLRWDRVLSWLLGPHTDSPSLTITQGEAYTSGRSTSQVSSINP